VVVSANHGARPATDDGTSQHDMIDVHQAAQRVGRHPETVRRWIWAGRLTARRDGRRLLVARADVDALIGSHGRAASEGLAAWSQRALAALKSTGGRDAGGVSAADLVLGDRRLRSGSSDVADAGN